MEVEAATYWLAWVRFGQLVAVFLVAIGVVAEFAGEYLSRSLERPIEAAREERLATLATEATSARAAIAEANARAAEANQKAEAERLERLKLEAAIAPRLITQAQQNELTARLSEFKGQHGTVIASPSTSEGEWFARILTAPLKAAGWEMEILPGTATATVLFPKGVIVSYAVDISKPVIFPEKTERAAAAVALVEKLKEYGIEATAMWGAKPPHTIEITITAK
jgi:hypothetical protein